MNIISAMSDPNLFADQFDGVCWDNWRALLKGFYALEMSDDERDIYNQLTQRTNSPDDAFRELWLVIGRRGGKSQIAALIAIYEAFFVDHQDKLSAGEVATVMLIAADRKQARSVFRYIKGLIESTPMLTAMVMRENTESIELTNRAVIEITTASVRKTRGYTCSCVILDEIAFFNTDTEAANPDKEIINALRPSLATLGGKLVALSSPYSRKGSLFEAYRTYFGKDDEHRVLVAQAPTALMNPLLDPDVIAQAYKEDPASAAAEYGAQFRTDVETYISREAVEVVTIPDRFELPPSRSNFYFAFTDPAGGSGKDSFTLAIAHRDKKTNQIIVDAIRAQKPPFSPSETIGSFCDVLNAYNIKSVTGDRYAGDFPRELFRNRGIAYNTSDKTRSDLYVELLPLINSGRVELLDDRRLFAELVNLERRTSRVGKDIINHPPNQHDDVINSVAGAIVNSASRNANLVNIRISRFGGRS